jgi:hypothetical protein
MQTETADVGWWLDEAAKKSGVPQLVDTNDAIALHFKITGVAPAVETFRRWPIPYRLINGVRRYEPRDVVAHAKRKFDEAPRVLPPQAPRRKSRAKAPDGDAPSRKSKDLVGS